VRKDRNQLTWLIVGRAWPAHRRQCAYLSFSLPMKPPVAAKASVPAVEA